MFKNLFFKLVTFSMLTGSLSLKAASLELTPRRIHAFLTLEEMGCAIAEATQLLHEFPDSPIAYQLLIKSLAAAGEEGKMMETWKQFHHLFSEKAVERELLEEMCWGILQKGRKAGGLTTQLISLLGSALTQQVRAVEVLKASMRDSNSHLRGAAVPLAALYADQTLREEIIRLFYDEKVWDVQKEVLNAISKLQLKFLLPDLMKRLNDQRGSIEQKKEIIATIVKMQQTIDHQELLFLVNHSRVVMRVLAAESMAVCQKTDERELLVKLLSDAHPDVRASALKAFGILRLPICPEVFSASQSRLAEVSVTAAWVLLLAGEPEGEKILETWLTGNQEEGRLLAAGAIGKAGKYGIPLALQHVESHPDFYVRLNLAIALLRQRQESEKACRILDACLEQNEKWMKDERFFSVICKSDVDHNLIIPNYPEVVNQTVRLEVLNLLCILEYPNAHEALKRFLKERRWGVTGIAAELLLGEGDENSVLLVRELLEDQDREVRTEAALVLAAWGRDPAALPTLKQVYHEGDRSLKLKVLESIGRLGEPNAIPFLLERLCEPSQILRIVAACVLIQTLNH